MRDYELVFIVSPEVAEESLPATIEKVSQFITAKGGAIAEVNQWGRRKFAYPIRKFSEGNYVLAHFKLEPEKTKELEANLKISEEILRHLLVKVAE